jgi:REP-associated tyrosine transposase
MVPRSPRDLAPGIQHIGLSAAGPSNYFRDDVDCADWVRRFARTLSRWGWVCLGFCLMSTHWHALVEIHDDSLARGMHRLNTEYTKAFNDRHSRVGYLVRDRYWSRRKTTKHEILGAFAYMVDNPLKAGACKRREDWFWSSYATTVGLADNFPFVDASRVLELFSPVRATALIELRRYLDQS